MAEFYLHSEPRTSSIPVLYTKGTHYEVGYDVVRSEINNTEIDSYSKRKLKCDNYVPQ